LQKYNPIFQSFFQAGFECSTHKTKSGRRLDLVASTRHDAYAKKDFEALLPFGITTVREGARWHLIEKQPGTYDFVSLDIILDAAEETGVEVILDVLHFGWPDYLDIFQPEFLDAFERFTRALTSHLKRRGGTTRFLAPVNEISFLAWAAGDEGFLYPFAKKRDHELKAQLIRAAIRASEVIRQELPDVRIVAPEPVIHIVGNPKIPGDDVEAERYRMSQFQAWDMLSGKLAPELGGKPEYLDIIGVNFYDRNEWVHMADVSMKRDDPRYRPFHQILLEVWSRYGRPIFVSETGTEDSARPVWLAYVCREVLAAIDAGVPVHGICLYPILNHPGWEDDRHCCNGLFDYADERGQREIYKPLADELLALQKSGAFDALARKPLHDQLPK
jgi:beta-glucosidase/6-phospho-beta-glucosidase/beta-galactosidase